MTPAGRAPPPPEATRFRRRLLLALTGVVAGLTAVVLIAARQRIAEDEERGLEREFQATLTTLHHAQELRHAALLERSRSLARRARIVAALEDEALDLLYLSARDELRDVTLPAAESALESASRVQRARFYRFLDGQGRVLTPPADDDACGKLSAEEEKQLALPHVVNRPQTGYLAHQSEAAGVSEVIATPILSSETGEPIAALVLGFDATQLSAPSELPNRVVSGVWLDPRLQLPGLGGTAQVALRERLRHETSASSSGQSAPARAVVGVNGAQHLLFFKLLNPLSLFPPAYEVSLFPLADMQARQRLVTWQILGVGAVLVLLGFFASQQLARWFSKPVAVLAQDSREQRRQRQRVEAALETTSAELERAARFSADASHQLKTPVTVLRAGLEELIARGAVPSAEIEEVSALIHQTFRLSTLIDDLLLLSRLDVGQLRIKFSDVDLGALIDASLDDLSAAPDGLELAIESNFPRPLLVAGERGYSAVILQNLLENARRYNRPGGRIGISARVDGGVVALTVGNTTRRPIPASAQPHIFERFHRGTMGEDVPGYGIGLNLARELARLHDGDLRLVRSDDAWTEFEVRFRSAQRL